MTRLQKKSMNIRGHSTSVALEPEFWDVLAKMAAKTKTSLAALITVIDEGRGDTLLASSCRVACLHWVMSRKSPRAAPTPPHSALKDDALASLKAIGNGDPERGHSQADQVLVDFITVLGFKEVADAYDEIEKWYA